MKRLIIVSMMLVSGFIQAEDEAGTSTATTQSPSETSSKKSDESSIAIANVHQISLDTTDVDGGGNWLNKRIWYERAQTSFDEIRAMVNAVGDLRIQFSNEVNAVGKKIDSFFETVDFTKGQLDDKFKEILVALDTEKKMAGDLSEEERNLQTTIKQELTAIEQVGTDIKSIGDVDNKIDQTLIQAFKTIDECRDYETKAWDTFKSIGKELDDKKARNLYYQMNNYKQNIDQKTSYLKATLLPYLHNVLVAKIENNIAKINETMEQLKTKGVDLEKIMSKSQEDDVTQFHVREKAAAEIAVKKALEEEQAKAKEATEKAAEKAAKELEEANKKSFSNVMNHYYDVTIGKVVNFVYQGYVALSFDYISNYFKSYSYPVITYCQHGVIAVRAYMHTLVEHIMIYFGGKPAVKAAIKDKISEKIAGADHPAEKLQQHIAEKIAEHKDAEKSEVKAEVAAAPVAVETVTTISPLAPTPTPAESSQPAHDVAVKAPEAVSTDSAAVASDKAVVVQSMKNDEQKQPAVNSFYKVFVTILDFLGTIMMSIYNCIMQFGKLLLNFSSYVQAS